MNVSFSASGRMDRVLVLLPEPALSKFQRLLQAKDDAWAVARPVGDKLSELLTEQARLEGREQELLRNVRVQMDAEEHPQVVAIRKELLRIEREIGRQRVEQEKRSARASALSGLIDNISLWIDKLPGDVEISLFDVVDSSDAPTMEMIDSVRDVIAGLRADIHTTMSAPIPSTQAKALMREQIKRLAEQGCPDCEQLMAHGGEIEWPRQRSQVFSSDKTNISIASVVDAAAIDAWLNQGALVKALERQIDQLANDDQALDDAARAARLTKLRSETLKNERIEEAMIAAAGERGTDVLRRRDADPRAVLGLADEVLPDGR